jgi:hypothetical protein
LGGRSAAGATAASGSSKHEFGHLVDKGGNYNGRQTWMIHLKPA